MASSGVRTTARVDGSAGPVSVEVLFGFANVGVYRIFLWDPAQRPTPVAFGDNVDAEPDLHALPAAPADLSAHQLSYEAQIESPSEAEGQMYSAFVLVRQDGRVVPGGVIERSGPLPETCRKSVIGFVTFEVA